MINKDYMQQLAQNQGFDLLPRQLEQLDCYAEFLVDYNTKVNLTAITDPEEIVVKHFLDSMMLLCYLPKKDNLTLIDVGTGAGFPGAVVKIVRPDIQVCLMDGLDKRITFLKQLCQRCGMECECLHARAEEVGKNQLREKFDVVTARAVANLRLLSELCLPLVKPGGMFVAMKGPTGAAEAAEATNGIKKLGGQVERIVEYPLLDAGDRSLVVVKKIIKTPTIYPRGFGQMKKRPL